MNLAAQLANRSRRTPGAPAVTADEKTINFEELYARSSRLAGALTGRYGVVAGDRVLIYMENRCAYVESLFASWIAGACVVPVNAKLHPREVIHILDDSGARVVVTSAALGAEVAALVEDRAVATLDVDSPAYAAALGAPSQNLHETSPTDVAWIFYTSGTTGFPKGAMLSHRNLLAVSLAYYADIERVEPGMTMLHVAALSHGAGQYLLPHLLAGGHQVLYRKFDPVETLRAINDFPSVSLFAVPTIVNRLVAAAEEHGIGPGNLRTIVYGGAPMYVTDLLRALDVFPRRLYQLFGQGETPMTICGLNHAEHVGARDEEHLARLATCGSARSGVEFRVVDSDGNSLPSGEPGEVVTRSDCVMSGYWSNPIATASALRDGWLWTGDIGSIDEAGRLSLRDRSKDMIISGGSNIYPREIEEILLRHPAIIECSVIGRPHGDLGEEVVAFVVCRSGQIVPAVELDALCLEHVARFKRPREYRFVDALPKSSYGKILKTSLRGLL